MSALLSPNWNDLLEKDFMKITYDKYGQIQNMIPTLFNVMKSNAAFEKTSAVGQVPDFSEFDGKIEDVEPTQGYDKTYTFTEYTAKIRIQRKLAADDNYRIMNKYPTGLATSAVRSKEKLGARIFNLAFTYEPSDGDGAELCASDHGSNVAGVPSQSNEGTNALNAANVETVRIAMNDFRSDINELIPIDPNTIIAPIALEQTGWEIINTKGKVDTANNNANFHKGKYNLIIWKRLTDTDNWFMTDYSMQKQDLMWFNREPYQFFQDKDSSTLLAIYLGYYRVGTGWDDWRFIYGNLV